MKALRILGCDAVLLNGELEVSVPDEDIGSRVILKVSDAILDKKLKRLRLNLPNKIIYMTAQDGENVLIRAEEADDKKIMN